MVFIKGATKMIHTINTPTPFAIGDVNATLVKGDTLTLFDVGSKTEAAFEALRWGIKEAGYDLSDIEQIVLTHHHPDHVGWVEAFPNADVLGHAYNDLYLRFDQDFIDYNLRFYNQHLHQQGVPEKLIKIAFEGELLNDVESIKSRPLTHFLDDGDILPGHPNLKAIYTPGHALGHLIFHDEKEHWAIGGDLLLPSVASNPLIEPPAVEGSPRPKSLLQYNASLELLKTLELEKVYPGHGDVVLNPNKLIDERLTRQHKQAMKVRTFLSDKPHNIFEINAMFYPAIYKREPGLTLSKTQGFIDYLMSLDLINEHLSENGIYMYTVK